MTSSTQASRILQAIDALKSYDRDRAVALLRDELRLGAPSGERWKGVAMLAANIGEIAIALEAARRYSLTEPRTLARQLHYWGELATFGRTELALSEVAKLSAAERADAHILHFLGTIAGQNGDFEEAADYYRQALAASPLLPQTWFALAMIKTFGPGDPDLAAMERHRGAMAGVEPSIQARFLYGLAKAWHDCGDHDRAFSLYAEGAALRRHEGRFDPGALTAFAQRLIRDFSPESMRALVPSGVSENRVIFVNGLPRSGTTLVEQILASHSEVADGAEINLLRAALIPTGDFSYAGALAYQRRFGEGNDPWGHIARQYFGMVETRFGAGGRIIDKTLSQSHLMGLLLHAMPAAKIVWMRRDPEDNAISCFRSFFSAPIPWTWSLSDIGHFFRVEDQLHRHWTTNFPDRILTVPYESLARDPAAWIPKILAHVHLAEEPQVFHSHETRRAVRTASVQQVRAPISADRIGLSRAYDRHLDPFRRAYRA